MIEIKPLSGFWVTFGQLFVYNLYRYNRGPLRWLGVIDALELLSNGWFMFSTVWIVQSSGLGCILLSSGKNDSVNLKRCNESGLAEVYNDQRNRN